MTNLSENLSVAFAAIMANKMRSVLTMLGIIIGISAVITIISIGSGQGKNMQDKMNNQGLANITISATQKEGVERVDNSELYIDQDLLKEVYQQYSDKCEGISLEINISDLEQEWQNDYVKTKRNSVTTYFKFTSETYWKSMKYDFLCGAPLSSSDFQNASRSIILTESQAINLFGAADENCIGQTVDCHLLNTYATFTVKGVIKQKMDFTASNYFENPLTGGYEAAALSYIPYRCYKSLTGKDYNFNTCVIVPKKGSKGDDILMLLESFKADMNAKAPDYMEYSARSNIDYIKQTADTTRNQFMVTALVAAIALIVGGIGVMNIMMVSITERTKEIGTRKALGATNGSLLLQFITEAILLCLIGGFIGIILGIIFGIVACNVMKLPYILEPLSIIISVVFSLLIGTFFGYYPASRAAKMDPIEALRYE